MQSSSFHRPRKLVVYQEKSASVARLMTALSKAMAEFAPVARDGTGEVIRNGRKVKYKYSTLDSLHRSTKPALLKYGVVPRQDYCVSDEGVTLVTSLSCGDEYVCSVLPIRQYEDQQRLKAHMSYMRRTAYEGILCLSAEDDSDGADEQLPADSPAADPATGSIPPSRLWAEQERMARASIEKAKTPAALDDLIAKVNKKIQDRDMDPHCLGRMEELADARLKEIKQEAAKHSPKESIK